MLRTRILTAVALAAVVGAAVFGLATREASLVFGLFWLVGADEWARLAGLGRPGRLVYAACFLVIVIAVLGGLAGSVLPALLGLAALIWVATFVFVLRGRVPVGGTAIALAGLVVLPAAWASFYLLHGVDARGPVLVLTALVIVWSADIGAYFVGRSLGRTPLAPRVSPKKTWEGVAGGVCGAAIAGAIAGLLLGLSIAVLAAVAAAMALISVVGDLGVSMLKRRAGLKDCGVLLPGHGGVMDRFDGVTAALPFFALGLQFTHVLD